jgi:stress response protein SCP2
MIVRVGVFSSPVFGLPDRPVALVRVIETLKYESLTHETQRVPLTNRVAFNFRVPLKLPMVESLKFDIYTDSAIYGLKRIAAGRLAPVVPGDVRLPLTQFGQPFPNASLDVGVEADPHPRRDGRLPATLALSKFLSISALSDSAPIKLCLVHVARDRSLVNYSRPAFNFLPSVKFIQNSILFEVNRLSAKWELFYVCVEGTGPITFVIDDAHCEMFNIPEGGLFVPFGLAFRSQTVADVLSVKKSIEKTAFSDLGADLNVVLTKLRLTVRDVPRCLKFDDKVAFFPGKDPLLVLLSHELPEQMDLSFATVSARGSLDKTCFFNEASVHGGAVALCPSKPDGYDAGGVIDLAKLPQSVQFVTIALSAFAGIPLAAFGRVALEVRKGGGDEIFLELPLALGQDPGFFVGAIERIDGGRWRFVWFGAGCKSKLPASVAKFTLTHLFPEDDEDVVWQ